MREAGTRLVGGSDCTVTTANPLLDVEVALRRVYPSRGDVSPFTAAQQLTLDEALAAYTIGSAYVNHLDGETGTIEVGKLAYLVMTGPRHPLAGRRVPGRCAGGGDLRRRQNRSSVQICQTRIPVNCYRSKSAPVPGARLARRPRTGKEGRGFDPAAAA
jgi:cytosine/adenosine deaminase-related metal-dependent hydrolase